MPPKSDCSECPKTRIQPSRSRARTQTGVLDTIIPEESEQPNPFIQNAQAFTPFSKSVSAVRTSQNHISAFRPAPAISPII